MALFKPYKITSDKLADLPVREGQIIITKDTHRLFVDVSATERIEVTSDAEVDLSDYVTEEMLTQALAEETAEREKQDGLLRDSIAEKLDQSQADDRYALKNNPELTGNINISNSDWQSGKISASHANGDNADYYKYVIGFDALHRPYISKRDGENVASTIYLDSANIVFDKPLSFTDASGVGTNAEAAEQTRQNIGAAAIEHTHDVATTDSAGFMSAEDKTTLDELAAQDLFTKDEADELYAAIDHNHDDRYYTESEVDSKLSAKADATHTHTIGQVDNLQETIDGLESDIAGKANATHTHDDRYFTETEVTDKLATKADTGHKHAASDITSGTFSLDRIPTITDAKISGLSASKLTGTIPTANLPSYVDDVVEGETTANFPEEGETGKIYVATSTNKTYRWSGSGYVEISASLALGTTSSTAFRGDYGNVAYTHATAKGSAFASGLYKITTNAQGHVTAATAVTKADITGLGIPAQDTNTNTTYALTKSGSTITLEGSDGSSTSVTDANTVYTHPTTSGNKHIPAGGSSGQILRWSADGTAAWGADNNTNTTYKLTKSGSTITLTGSDGSKTSVTDADTNTTYSAMKGATSSVAGSTGLVPAPAAGKQTSFLRGDGTWVVPTNTTYSNMTGATTSAAGKAGLVPAPAAGAATRYLRSDGTWQVPPDTNTTYTLSSFGITATAAELNKLDGCTATVTELNYVDGVTSNIQTQLNGKAASSHTHNYAGSSSAGGAATSAAKINGIQLTNQNLNNYYSGVNFYYAGGGNTCTNKPSGVDNFGMFVFQTAGGWWTQVLYGSDDDIWTRRYASPSWTSWVKFYSTGNKPTASEIGAAASSHTHTATQVTGLTASRALVSNSSGQPAVSAVTSTELGYLDGVTSSIQTQLNGKAASSHTHSNATTSAAGFLPKLGGGTTNFLRADGTWAKPPDTNTTYSQMTGATASAAGKTGLVPAPAAGYQSRYLRGDGTWATVTATSANQLTTARTFSLTGDVTGSASFNGTANCSIATTLAANSVTANEIASGAVGLSELSSTVGTVAVQSATPTDSHVKLWIKV